MNIPSDAPTIAYDHTHAAGLGIGFSENRRTNAMAVLSDGKLSVQLMNARERNQALEELHPTVIAVDAPILADDAAHYAVRACEAAFSVGVFQRRCKPGMSHVPGTGLQLREHGGTAGIMCASATSR